MPLKECADWPQNGIKENAERRTNPRSNNHPTVKPIL